jgi:hypothetical protein
VNTKSKDDAQDKEIADNVRRVINLATRILRQAKSDIPYVRNERLREELRLEIQEFEVL